MKSETSWRIGVPTALAVCGIWLGFFPPQFLSASVTSILGSVVLPCVESMLDLSGVVSVAAAAELELTDRTIDFADVHVGLRSLWMAVCATAAITFAHTGRAREAMLDSLLVAMVFPALLTISLSVAVLYEQWRPAHWSAVEVIRLAQSVYLPLMIPAYLGARLISEFFFDPVGVREWHLLPFRMILLGCLLFPLLLSPFVPVPVRHLSRTSVSALEAGDTNLAKLCLERLVARYPFDLSAKIDLARVYETLDEEASAEKLMQEAGAVRHVTSQPARIWLARRLASEIDALTPEEFDELKEYASKILEFEPENVEALSWLGHCHVASRNYEAARFVLAKTLEARPLNRLIYADLLNALGDEPAAQEQRLLAERFLEEQLAAEPNNRTTLESLARLSAQRGEYQRAVQYLKSIAPTDRDGDIARLESLVILGQARRFLDADPPDPVGALNLIKSTLQSTAANKETLYLLEQLGMRFTAYRPRVIGWLEEEGTARFGVGPSAVVLGNLHGYGGDYLAAIKHYEIARQASPNDLNLLNNLAYALIQLDSPQAERALQICDQAQQLAASADAKVAGEYLVTRGKILAKLGRWLEAIDAFTKVLVIFPDREDVHQSLAAGYRELGMLDLAEIHEGRVQQIRNSMPPATS